MLGGIIQKLFGSKTDFKALVDNGAEIIDVRNPDEFKNGHIRNAKNIPLSKIPSKISSFKGNQTYILCCQSGARSGMAVNLLKSNGVAAINGGGWRNLNKKLGS